MAISDWVVTLYEFQCSNASLSFASALLIILLCHEWDTILSESLMVHTSLPIFVPFPFALGTLGAIIKLRSLPRQRMLCYKWGLLGHLWVVCMFDPFDRFADKSKCLHIMMTSEEYERLSQSRYGGNICIDDG